MPTPSRISRNEPTPLPWDKLIVVFLMRLAEPISFSIIYPFIAEKIWVEFGIAKSKAEVGFWAGMIESTFAIAQTFTVLHWGRLSDRIGRKKVMLIGLAGVACSLIGFGFSKSLFTAILSRSLAGALNGNAAVVKSLIGELTDISNNAKGFSLISVGWGLGMTIGPLLGGNLSRPAEVFPHLFARHAVFGMGGFWEANPYALPCFVSALITVLSIILGAVFLEETLPSIVEKKKRQKRRLEASSTYGATATSTTSTIKPSNGHSAPSQQDEGTSLLQNSSSISTDPQPSAEARTFSLLRIPHIRKVVLSYAFLALSSASLDAVLVLFLYTPIKLGGLSMSSKQSGAILSLTGIIGTCSQLFLFPFLQRRLGTVKLYAICMSFIPLVPLLLPATNLFARANLNGKGEGMSLLGALIGELKEGGKSRFSEELGENAKATIWVLLVVSSACRVMGGISFSCNTIMVNDCAKLTQGEALGTLNGLAQIAASLMRAIGPYSASSLFAISISRQLVGGEMIWIVLFILGVLGSFVTSRIRSLETKEEAEERTGILIVEGDEERH